MDTLYFLQEKYEKRVPPAPQKQSEAMQMLFQFFGIITIMLGGWYIYFRWTETINYDALWFSLPLLWAETMMYISTILMVVNFWRINDTPKQTPPATLADVHEENSPNKKIKIDIYIPVFNEEPELVRETIKAAKKVKKLDSWEVEIYLLDDSKNPKMAQMAQSEGIEVIQREKNKGRKAGAITNAIDITKGDFIVIIDSDTRLFSDILLNTMGYFRDRDVAWVQTPQWFCDLTEDDVFSNDPKMFFDVIQRRRNNYNASFCCGATSIHRVSALKEVAEYRYQERVNELRAKGATEEEIKELDREYIVYHTSEDIYSSLIIHSYPHRDFKSVFHPEVESKMLSPQDLLTWTTQRFRYAGGTIDLIKKEWKRFLKGGWSIWQKLMYFSTFWSYTGAIWITILLLTPIIYMFTNIPPVSSYSMQFFIHLVPFLFVNQIALMIATWGIDSNRGSQFSIAIFPIVLKAFYDVARGKPIHFVVTSKSAKSGNFLSLVKIQIFFIVIYLIAIIYAGVLILLGIRDDLIGYSVNVLWAIYNITALWAIVRASLYKFEG